MHHSLLCTSFLICSYFIVQASNQPIELGKVKWNRDFQKSLAKAAQEDKPVFILFQEVPGCSTCQQYGKNVLSHPLIVEAIETLFVPVAIYNNKGGADKKVLNYFKEPTWNNPVVRIVDARKNEITPRLAGNYSELGVVRSMITALQSRLLDVPEYLSLLEAELLANEKGLETTYLSMYCFWTGEKQLGKLDGVIETQPGFMDGKEVVKVSYNPENINYEDLLAKAKQMSCASHVYTADPKDQNKAAKIVGQRHASSAKKFRMDKEPKYYLSKTTYQYIPMTSLQAARVNSLIGQMKSPDHLLSPRQKALVKYIKEHSEKNWTSAINEDIVKAWEKVDKIKG